MGVREYLEEREKELVNEADLIFIKMAQLRADLVPIEGELAEVRRAKNAIGTGGIVGTEGIGSLGQVLVPSLGSGIGSFGSGIGGFGGGIGGGNALISVPPEQVPPSLQGLSGLNALGRTSPYDHLTMKQLVVKALEEHFHDGATTRQLLDFFRDAWGREVERTNLSPQISRLYHDEEIGRSKEGAWFLLATRKLRDGDTRFLKRSAEDN